MARRLARSPKQVIDQAIKDNRYSEWILYGFAVAFVLAGMTALIWGMVRGEGVIAVAGAIAGGLFFPAMYQAREIRRENIAIRLLESPLNMAATSKEAADTLREFFATTFVKK
jgi:hypothetical protein